MTTAITPLRIRRYHRRGRGSIPHTGTIFPGHRTPVLRRWPRWDRVGRNHQKPVTPVLRLASCWDRDHPMPPQLPLDHALPKPAETDVDAEANTAEDAGEEGPNIIKALPSRQANIFARRANKRRRADAADAETDEEAAVSHAKSAAEIDAKIGAKAELTKAVNKMDKVKAKGFK